MIKEFEKKPAISYHNLRYWLRGKEKVFIFVSIVEGIFKGTNTLKSILKTPKEKNPSQLKQNTVYIWSYPGENCNISYIGESIRRLENRVKEHNSHVTSVAYKCSISNNNPKPTSPTSG